MGTTFAEEHRKKKEWGEIYPTLSDLRCPAFLGSHCRATYLHKVLSQAFQYYLADAFIDMVYANRRYLAISLVFEASLCLSCYYNKYYHAIICSSQVFPSRVRLLITVRHRRIVHNGRGSSVPHISIKHIKYQEV